MLVVLPSLLSFRCSKARSLTHNTRVRSENRDLQLQSREFYSIHVRNTKFTCKINDTTTEGQRRCLLLTNAMFDTSDAASARSQLRAARCIARSRITKHFHRRNIARYESQLARKHITQLIFIALNTPDTKFVRENNRSTRKNKCANSGDQFQGGNVVDERAADVFPRSDAEFVSYF